MQGELDQERLNQISVIIPVLNEANNLPKVLAKVQSSHSVEVIVVDGGSRDETVELARSLGVLVVTAPIGRALQMNAGAAVATGEILLFLHADTRLPTGFDICVKEILAQPGVVAGAFALNIDASLRGLRLLEALINWRSRFLQMPYGDQAIFLKNRLFCSLNGFPEIPIMEDFEFVRRLKRQGRIAIVPTPVLTSGRRWQKLGVLKTTLINQVIILAYLIGVSPDRIVHWYRGNSAHTTPHDRRSH